MVYRIQQRRNVQNYPESTIRKDGSLSYAYADHLFWKQMYSLLKIFGHRKANKPYFLQVIIVKLSSPVERDIATLHDKILLIFYRCFDHLLHDRAQVPCQSLIVLQCQSRIAAILSIWRRYPALRMPSFLDVPEKMFYFIGSGCVQQAYSVMPSSVPQFPQGFPF